MSERRKQKPGQGTFFSYISASVVLVLGAASFISPGTSSGQEPGVEAPTIFLEAKTALAEGKLVKSKMHGPGQIQNSFTDCSDNGAILTGFELGLARGGKNPDILFALRPIYRTDKGEVYFQEFGLFKDKTLSPKKILKSKVTLVAQLKARPGYAVGAIHLHAGKSIHALALTYMRITGKHLDPRQNYSSHWYGNPGLGKGVTLGGNGAPLVGLFGNQNDHQVLALGVFQMPAPVIATNPLAASGLMVSPPSYSLLFKANSGEDKINIQVPIQPTDEFSNSSGRFDRPNELAGDLTVSLDPVSRGKFPPPVQPKTEETVTEEVEEPITAYQEEVSGVNFSWLPLLIFALITVPAFIFFIKHARGKKAPEIPQPKRPDTDALLASALGSLMQPKAPHQPQGDVSSLLSTAISQPSAGPSKPTASQPKTGG